LLFIIVIIIVIIVNLQYVFDLYLFDIYTAAISCSCYLLQLQDRLLAVIAEASPLSDGLEASPPTDSKATTATPLQRCCF
jgi:hypothetical protein